MTLKIEPGEPGELTAALDFSVLGEVEAFCAAMREAGAADGSAISVSIDPQLMRRHSGPITVIRCSPRAERGPRPPKRPARGEGGGPGA